MKKVILIFLSIIVLSTGFTTTAISEEIPVFSLEEGITFGMSMSEVTTNSMQDFHKGSKTELICDTTICNIDTSMALNFGKQDQLYEIICWLETENMKAKYCIPDYEDISNDLVERYGDKARTSGQKWKSKKVADKYGSDFASALDNRSVVLMECWDFTDVYIVHVLAKTSGNKIQHFLSYYSPDLHPEFEKAKKEYGF